MPDPSNKPPRISDNRLAQRFADALVAIRGVIVAGTFTVNKRISRAGERITIGPLTAAWQRLTIPRA